jgi:hypothetical protein
MKTLTLDLTTASDAEIDSFVAALTRRSLEYAGVAWAVCRTCAGSGRLEQMNPHLPLVDCHICRGEGGTYERTGP